MTGREGVRIRPGAVYPITVAPKLPTEPAMPPSAPVTPGAWVRVPVSVKALRETLAVAQTEVCNADAEYGKHAKILQELIDQCDLFRPLGPDGKHGDLHTPWCGCEL